MRLFKALVSVALVADAALASSWFSKASKFTASPLSGALELHEKLRN